jgi:purine-binding chemotaxis protein CheW
MAEALTSHLSAADARYLTFRVDGRLYALPAGMVAEVIHVPPTARIPQAPAALMGIGNLRGTVLPVVSLRVLLGLPAGHAPEGARAIVLAAGAPLALVVDKVERLAAVAAQDLKTDQGAVSAANGEILTAMFQTAAGGAKILDIQTLLANAFAARAKDHTRTRAVGAGRARAETQRNAAADILVTFDVAGQAFALPIEVVLEIVPPPDAVTAMPQTEDVVMGLMVLRDELLPLLSLRGLLGLARSTDRGREQVVVTRIGGQVVGLVADRARSVLSAARARIESLPSILAARTRGEAKIAALYRPEKGGRAEEDGKVISILAPAQLFREDVMQRLGAKRAGTAEAPDTDTAGAAQAQRAFLVFRLGADEFGLPIDVVDEVATVPEKITKLPKTPKFLEGVINLRGNVLPVVDQRKRFDMPKLDASEKRRLIVVRTERHRAGLIVDSVSDILRASDDAIESTPHLTEDASRLIHGVINIEKSGRIVLLLDPNELLTRAEEGLLDTFARQAKSTDQ